MVITSQVALLCLSWLSLSSGLSTSNVFPNSRTTHFGISLFSTANSDDALHQDLHRNTTLEHSGRGDKSDLLVPKPKFSKVKWKKKRYLMMQDVKKHIQQNHPQAPRKAEELVRRMMRLYENSGGDEELRPTLQVFNLWIHALAKSNWKNAGVMAEQVMNHMTEHGIRPDVVTYTSVMDAHARSESPEQAEAVLFRLLDEANSNDLSSVTFDTMLNAWAQQGTLESAQRAQTILFGLEQWQRNEIKPTKISYATVMNAWAKVGTPEAASMAESLLRRMIKTDGGGQLPRPDTIMFNIAINAWASSKDLDAGRHGMALLNEMKDLAQDRGYETQPDIVTWNSVLSGWSNSGDPNAAAMAEKIVQEMQKNASKESEHVRPPNTVSYNCILHAWAKSPLEGAVPRAQKVLDYMLHSGREEIAPDVTSFSSVLDAWAKSKEPHKSAKCRELLEQMIQQYASTKNADLKPTIIPYNSLLNSCAFSALGTTDEEQREALQIAVKTFSEIIKSREVAPDTVTYGNMIKCFANLMPPGNVRSTMALQVFQRCCSDGMVGNLAWNEVRRAAPQAQLKQALKLKGAVGLLKLKDLPRSWRKSNRLDRNAPEAKSRAREKSGPTNKSIMVETAAQSGRDV